MKALDAPPLSVSRPASRAALCARGAPPGHVAPPLSARTPSFLAQPKPLRPPMAEVTNGMNTPSPSFIPAGMPGTRSSSALPTRPAPRPPVVAQLLQSRSEEFCSQVVAAAAAAEHAFEMAGQVQLEVAHELVSQSCDAARGAQAMARLACTRGRPSTPHTAAALDC